MGGLAGVFRGLTSSRKSPPPQPTLGNVSTVFSPDDAGTAAATNGFPPEHMGAFQQLKNGTINERISAAHTLSFAIADYPLAPVCISGNDKHCRFRPNRCALGPRGL